jgi:hypothetical protein
VDILIQYRGIGGNGTENVTLLIFLKIEREKIEERRERRKRKRLIERD